MEDQQELIFKLQMLEQQMQNLQQQLQSVEQAAVEITNLQLGLDDLVGGKDKEVLALIGKGIYAKAKLVSEDLIVNIGEKNFVTKSVPDTKEIINEQIAKLNEAKEYIHTSLEETNTQMTDLIMKAQKELQ